MVVPPTSEIKSTMEQKKLSFKECTLACYDIKTHKTLPKAAFIVQLGEPVNISNTKSDASFEKPPETFEISVQIEVDQLEPHLRSEVSRQGSQAFNSILRAALSSSLVIQTYAIGWDPQTMYGLARVPVEHSYDILKRSGPNGIYIKEKIRDGVKAQCNFALIHSSHLKDKTFTDVLEQATSLPHYGGVHRSNTGSKSFRFQANGIEQARRKLCKDDMFTDDNISIITNQYHQVQGLPMGTSSAAVQQVVEDRIQHMEKRVMDKVNDLVDDLRSCLQSDINKINSQSSTNSSDQSKILQHVDGLLSQMRQEHDNSVKQIAVRQDASEKNVEGNIKALRDNHDSTQSQLTANTEQLNAMSTHLQELRQQQSSMEAKILQAISAQARPPRKNGRDDNGDVSL
eukprot:s1606_g4.t1